MQKIKKLINKDPKLIPSFWQKYHDDKDSLRIHIFENELHNCCVYCEKPISTYDIQKGMKASDNYKNNIEHICPRKTCKDKYFDFFNLTCACKKCNAERGSYYNNKLLEVFANPDEYIELDVDYRFVAKESPYKDIVNKFLDALKINVDKKGQKKPSKVVENRAKIIQEIIQAKKDDPSLTNDDLIAIFGFPSIVNDLNLNDNLHLFL